MEYSKIISVTGLPGLFELVSTKSDGGIVRSLDDKTTKFVSSRVHQFSHLESIEVYTTKHNVNLVTVLQAMDASTEKLPDEKNNAELKKYFEKVYPEIDFDRVYSSDLKKMVKWFSGLKKSEVELKLSEPAVEEEEVEEEAETVPEPKKAPAKKTVETPKEPEAVKAKAKEPAAAKAKPVKKEEPKKEEVKKKAAKPAAKAAKEKKPSKAAKPAAKDAKSKKK